MNISFEVEKIIEVENAEPGTVKLYDYYNSGKLLIFFKIKLNFIYLRQKL